MDGMDLLVTLAVDMASGRGTRGRGVGMLEGLRRVIPFDAAVLWRVEGEGMEVVASVGLSAGALGLRYRLREHPRLEIIDRSEGPVVFPADSGLPDPFDGWLSADPAAAHRVHSCLGVPLRVRGERVGMLTADALDPGVFAGLDLRMLTAVGALLAAELHADRLMEALRSISDRRGEVVRDLVRDAWVSAGGTVVGTSPVMERLRREIDLVSRSDFAVLVTGETGVGKELVVRALHAGSLRRDQPLIYVNCAALPETLAESELFGHVRGAFTGAAADRAGKFEVADGGTLFLDEIGELPPAVQPKLLRAIQEGEIQRVGSDRVVSVDVRLVAATNRDLPAEVEAGRFRADLYHRLAVYPLVVPPLRERASDVSLLAGYFGDVVRRRLGLGPVRFSAEALAVLEGYRWPGNVRELDHVVSRVVLRGSAGVSRGDPVVVGGEGVRRELGVGESVPAAVPVPAPPAVRETLRGYLRRVRRERIAEVLAAEGGNVAAAARVLGMDRGNLHRLVGRLGLRPVGTRGGPLPGGRPVP